MPEDRHSTKLCALIWIKDNKIITYWLKNENSLTKNIHTYTVHILDKGRIKAICVSVILTPVKSFQRAQMNYSDSILPCWKETHLAPLKGNPLLKAGYKGRAAALPHMMPASPSPQITPSHGYKGHQFVITNNTASLFPHSEGCHPLLFFRTPLPLSASVWWGRYQGHLWIEKIIGFGKWIDGSVWSAKFGEQSLHAYHAAQLHTAGFLCFMAPR